METCVPGTTKFTAADAAGFATEVAMTLILKSPAGMFVGAE
jgi:hypothetical protein